MTPSEMLLWGQTRARGQARFIIIGLVPRGFLIASLLTLAFYISDYCSGRPVYTLAEVKCLTACHLALTILVGWAKGAHLWHHNEREYQETSSEPSSHA